MTIEKEIESIENKELREKLIYLYEHQDQDCYKIISEILNMMFNPFGIVESNKISIPIEFFKTSIGKLIFQILGKSTNEYYTVPEFIELTKTNEKPSGYSKQYILNEIKMGNIKAKKDTGRWIILKLDAEEYLKNKREKKGSVSIKND